MAERAMEVKVVLLGDSGVGKTGLMRRYIKDRFDDNYRSLGLDYLSKDVKVGNTNFTVQVWDTSGQTRFSKYWPTYYNGADCCILVFDLSDVESFKSLEKWKAEFLEKCSPQVPEEFPFVVVGNKTDSIRRVPPEWTSMPIGNEENYPCIETSARRGHNVDQCFKIVVHRAISYKHTLLSRKNNEENINNSSCFFRIRGNPRE